MRVDLHKRDTSRNRLLLTGQAIVPIAYNPHNKRELFKSAAETPEPPFRIFILPFSSSLSDEENRQLVQRRSDAKPNLQQEQHRTSSLPKVARVHAPDTSSGSAPRHASGKTNPPPLLDREKEQLFQQFLEWRSRQKEVP